MLRASEQNRADIVAMRRWWRCWQKLADARRLVFLDETGVNTKMARLYGRSVKGTRCFASVPHGHWNSSTFIAAMRVDGLSAPLLIDGAMNREMFTAYVEQQLVPTLRPGEVVICDNLSSHRSKEVRTAIEAAGASILYLPPYSPDLNPIEMVFAKLKAYLRKLARRSWDDLVKAINLALDTFTPEHCHNFFAHAEYSLSN